MNGRPLEICILGLTITSSWGNGHATTYRALVRALAARGHQVHFLERDVPWYAENRDQPSFPFCDVGLYGSLAELSSRFAQVVSEADVCIVGSFVPEGIDVGRWVQSTARGCVAFYDIDTPETLAALGADRCTYLKRDLMSGFDLYFSFTGGPTLDLLERRYGVRRARPLYCAVDPEAYRPEPAIATWDLGYMGTYSADRQGGLEALLLGPARGLPDGRFVVAGPLYPADVVWPSNVERIEHLPPSRHRNFYNRQRFTLNLTRANMITAGHSPSVRLFEAAACGVPIISDAWAGLDQLFVPDEEILIAQTGSDVLAVLNGIDDGHRHQLGEAARRRVLREHTADHRAAELEGHVAEVFADGGRAQPALQA
jgi:spore maturation protein CgeB